MFGCKQNFSDIYALQRSELLDEDTCNFCLSMDGRTVSVDDEIAEVDEFHNGCRGIWVEILKDEVNPPEITGIPKELRDVWNKNAKGNVQLKDPILDPNSLAYEYYHKKKN